MAENTQPVNVTVTTSSTTPGYKTTEFWKSAIVSAFGLIMASGIVPSTGFWGQIAGLIAATLVTLGYTQARAAVKTAAPPQE